MDMNITRKASANYSYFICVSGALQQLVSLGMVYSAFSAYLPYISANFQYTNAQTSLIITMRSLSILLCLAFVDKFIEKLGARKTMLLSDILAALGFFAFFEATKITDFYIGAILIGACTGLGGLPTVSVLINRWFATHKATALGISSVGSSIAIMVMPTLTALFVECIGLKNTFFLESIFIIFSSVVVWFVVHNTPEEVSAKAFGSDNIHHVQNAKKTTFNRRQTPISRQDYILIFLAVGILGASGNVISFLTMLYVGNGYSTSETSYILSAIGIILIFGKVVFGRMTDKIGAFFSSTVISVLMIVGTILSALSFIHSTVLLLLAMLCNGFGWAITSLGLNITAELFATEEQYDRFAERFTLAYTLGCLISSYAVGYLADQTGSYVIPFYACALLGVISLVIRTIIFKRTK